MDALAALITRTSAGPMVEPGPDASQLERIVAAGQRAPDHGRLRPWRFFAVRGAALQKFGDLLAGSLKQRDPAASEDMLAREAAKAARAPLILVVGAKVKTDFAKVPVVEQLLATGAAAQNVLLAAHAMGFGAVWKTGPAAYDPMVKAAFGLAADDAIVGFIYVGTPARPPQPAPGDPALFAEWRGTVAR